MNVAVYYFSFEWVPSISPGQWYFAAVIKSLISSKPFPVWWISLSCLLASLLSLAIHTQTESNTLLTHPCVHFLFPFRTTRTSAKKLKCTGSITQQYRHYSKLEWLHKLEDGQNDEFFVFCWFINYWAILRAILAESTLQQLSESNAPSYWLLEQYGVTNSIRQVNIHCIVSHTIQQILAIFAESKLHQQRHNMVTIHSSALSCELCMLLHTYSLLFTNLCDWLIYMMKKMANLTFLFMLSG